MRSPSFLRTFVVYGIGAVGRRVAGLLLVPIYTRYLTPEDYGVLNLVGAFARVVAAIVGLGISTSVLRFYLRETEDGAKREILGACLGLLGLMVVPGILLSAGSRPIAGILLDDPGLWLLLVLSLVSSYGDLFSKIPLAPVRARQQSGLFVTISSIFWISTIGLSIFFVVVLRLGVLGVLAAQAIVDGVGAIVLLVLLLREGIARPRSGLVASILRFGLPLVPAALSEFALNLADRYILKLYRPMAEVGIYSIGYRLAEGVSLASSAFALAWVPFAFGEANAPDGRRRIASVGTTWFGVILLASVGLSAFAPEAVWILTPPSYHAAAAVVPPILIGLGLSSVYQIATIGFHLANRTGPIAILTGIAAAMNIGLNFLWVPAYGVMGAAWATAAAYAFQFGATFAIGQRVFHLPIPFARWGLGGVLAGAAGWLCIQAGRLGVGPAIGAKVAILGLLFLALIRLDLARPGHIRRILGWLRNATARKREN